MAVASPKRESRVKDVLRTMRDKGCLKIWMGGDFSDEECLTALFSGFKAFDEVAAIIPQIYIVVKEKTGDGLSLWATMLDVLISILKLSYMIRKGEPITAWLGTFIVFLEKASIPSLKMYYVPDHKMASLFALGCLFLILFLSTLVPEIILEFLQYFEIPLIIIAVALQFYSNMGCGGLPAFSVTARIMSLSHNIQSIIAASLDYYLDAVGHLLTFITDWVKLLGDTILIWQFFYIHGITLDNVLNAFGLGVLIHEEPPRPESPLPH